MLRRKKDIPAAASSIAAPRTHPATSARIYTDEERDFLREMERFQDEHNVRYPAWSDVLAVLRSLGYRRVEEPQPLPPPRRDRRKQERRRSWLNQWDMQKRDGGGWIAVNKATGDVVELTNEPGFIHAVNVLQSIHPKE